MATAKKVTVIPATKRLQDEKEQTVRVAAYCRVSTDNDDQLDSLENQVETFQTELNRHKNWEMVKIYVDEGITGTSIKKRVQFNQMIADCKAGKIDYIMTKSISRFARNTLDCINYVRQLHEYGVRIYFDKENLDTSSLVSEMLLALMASFAQEESRSLSENLKWGIRKRFSEGIELNVPIYGYIHTDKEKFVIVPEEAKIVREIYERYLHGEEPMKIMDDMMKRRVKPPAGKKWNRLQIDRMLNNEKYTGDTILQKTFLVNHLTHKQVKNNGELPMYHLEDVHPAIIDKHVFEQVQTIQGMKNVKIGNTTYPYGTILKCPHCGKTLMHGDVSKFFHACKPISGGAWGCYKDGGCGEYLVIQQTLNEAVIRAYREKYGEDKKSVEYYWLDDTMTSIAPSEDSVTITWKDGTETKTDLRFWGEKWKPTTFAGAYNNFLERIRKGEIKTFKKNLMGLNKDKEEQTEI